MNLVMHGVHRAGTGRGRRLGGHAPACAVRAALSVMRRGSDMGSDMLRKAGFQTLASLVYPPRCLSCGGLVETDFGLCGACWRETPFISGLAATSAVSPCRADGPGGALRRLPEHRAALDARPRGAALSRQGPAACPGAQAWRSARHREARGAGWPVRCARSCLRAASWCRFRCICSVCSRDATTRALLGQALARTLSCDWCPDALERRKATRLSGRQEPRRAVRQRWRAGSR